MIAEFGTRIKEVMLGFLHFGVAVPGGAEALASRGEMGAVAVVDVDLVNSFWMFEWPATLKAVDENLLALKPWLRWCTTCQDYVRLPCGEWVTSDRGAGQGEPEGPLKAALTVGRAVQLARQDVEARLVTLVLRWWFIDDGQLLVHPWAVDQVLRALDARLAEAGASRGSKAQGHEVRRLKELCDS